MVVASRIGREFKAVVVVVVGLAIIRVEGCILLGARVETCSGWKGNALGRGWIAGFPWDIMSKPAVVLGTVKALIYWHWKNSRQLRAAQ